MAITSAICSTFKKELMTATHNFTTTSGNTFKVALIKANASQTGTYNAGTTSYTTITGNSDELANGNGYTTGGNTLTVGQGIIFALRRTSAGNTPFINGLLIGEIEIT